MSRVAVVVVAAAVNVRCYFDVTAVPAIAVDVAVVAFVVDTVVFFCVIAVVELAVDVVVGVIVSSIAPLPVFRQCHSRFDRACIVRECPSVSFLVAVAVTVTVGSHQTHI